MKRSCRRRRPELRGQAEGLVSQAGAELLYRTAEASGLTAALTEHLAPLQRPGAVHDPGKVVLDLVVMLAAGGDSPTDTGMLRGKQGLCGPVASEATISRLMAELTADGAGLTALRRAAIVG